MTAESTTNIQLAIIVIILAIGLQGIKSKLTEIKDLLDK